MRAGLGQLQLTPLCEQCLVQLLVLPLTDVGQVTCMGLPGPLELLLVLLPGDEILLQVLVRRRAAFSRDKMAAV